MCARQAHESTGKRAGESEEEIFKQKYRLENKQRRARKSERENVCMCGCVCARARVYDRQQAAQAAEPKIIWCERERPLPLPVTSAAATFVCSPGLQRVAV